MTEKKKTIDEMIRENPDAYDYADARPGPSTYPAENRERILPEVARTRLAELGKLEKYLGRVKPKASD